MIGNLFKLLKFRHLGSSLILKPQAAIREP
jgi:hypothetical protein